MLEAALHDVKERVRKQQPFVQIEAVIEGNAKLSDEQKSFAWIYAWLGGEPAVIADALGRRNGNGNGNGNGNSQRAHRRRRFLLRH